MKCPLTDADVCDAQPGRKPGQSEATGKRIIVPVKRPYRLHDARGRYVEVHMNGSTWWRFKYRFGGKEKRLSMGIFPQVGLVEARAQGDQATVLLSAGIDPAEYARMDKAARRAAGAAAGAS